MLLLLPPQLTRTYEESLSLRGRMGEGILNGW